MSGETKNFKDKEGICCVCGGRYTLYGNNPAPLTEDKDARCCTRCDYLYVIPARFMKRAEEQFTLEDAKLFEKMRKIFSESERMVSL